MNTKKESIIENDLSFALSLFHEGTDTKKMRRYMSDYTIKFCLKHNLTIDETLEIVNNALSQKKQVKKEWIVPSSKNSQKTCVHTTLFSLIKDSSAFLNPKEAENIISNFCNLTGIDTELATPIIKTKIRNYQKNLIETMLYDAIMKTKNNSSSKNIRQEIKNTVLEFSDALGTTPQYTLGVLNRKIKAEKQKSLPDSQGDFDGR